MIPLLKDKNNPKKRISTISFMVHILQVVQIYLTVKNLFFRAAEERNWEKKCKWALQLSALRQCTWRLRKKRETCLFSSQKVLRFTASIWYHWAVTICEFYLMYSIFHIWPPSTLHRKLNLNFMFSLTFRSASQLIFVIPALILIFRSSND